MTKKSNIHDNGHTDSLRSAYAMCIGTNNNKGIMDGIVCPYTPNTGNVSEMSVMARCFAHVTRTKTPHVPSTHPVEAGD